MTDAFTSPSPARATLEGMSMAEPFLPSSRPARDAEQAERDLDVEAAPGTAEPEVDLPPAGPFRTPVPGDRLSADQLADEIGDGEPADCD
ncbi:hypothetical protein [Rathayibacter sp. VKM Ac-2630]|uniref:hypothetical protein n=1 Tax=Rathayibacter sp. VKM Ac-2630 TaxID=1938617 RepID=UPI00098238F0|nr:hypothetical protein [Rathayibacter sp. VKM Ac-2630]OOB91261.1 hypothetical protein B0T42_07005 [Rathayibacter sp. VKM Ac-2630]